MRVDRGLRVIFRRPELDVGAVDHEGHAVAAELGELEVAGEELHDAEVAFEDGRGAAQAFCGQQRGEDAVASGVSEGATLPFAQFARARLPGGNVGDAGQAERVRGLRRIELHELAGRQRGRKAAVEDVVPAVLAQAGGVAQPALIS